MAAAALNGAAPLIVGVAPNGARRTKADHPALPMTAAELAATAPAVRDAGAAMIHLHVRDESGGHTLDADTFRRAIDAVREAVGDDLVVQATSEAVGIYGPAEQMAMVRAVRPESVSLAARELAPTPADEAAFADFLSWLVEEGILPQYIIYTPAEHRRFEALCEAGVIPRRGRNILLALGHYTADRPSAASDLLGYTDGWDPDAADVTTWFTCAFGARESACAIATAALGGHPRVGFENNLLLADGAVAPDNAALVRQVASAAALIGRPLADAATARRLFAGGS